MASEKSKLIARAVRGQSVFVYAASSKDPVLAAEHAHKSLNQKVTSAFECSDCGTNMHVVASASPEPYCVTCGSDRVVESNRKVPETAAFVNDKELASISCGSCDTENIMPASAVKAAAGKVHCALCGSGLSVVSAEFTDGDVTEGVEGSEVPAVTDKVATAGDSLVISPGEDDFPDLSGDSNDAYGSDEEDENEETGDAIDDTGSEDDSAFTEGEGFEEDADMADTGDFNMDAEHAEDDYAVPSFQGLDGLEEDGNEEELFLDAYEGGTDGQPLLDALELNDTPDALTFVSKAKTLLAMKGAHVVAFANAKTTGKNADVLHTPEYAKAIAITASRTGVRKALAKFGFTPITVKPVDTAAVSKSVAIARSEFAAAQGKKDSVFADSIAIAAAGFARGVWRDAKNPLRAALEAQLSISMTPRNAKATASRILTQSGLEYSKELVAYATKLSALSTTARKEYADMLNLVSDDAGDMLDETADTEDEDMLDGGSDVGQMDDAVEDMDNVTSRLSTAALLRRPSEVRSSAKAETASSRAKAILAGKAPLGLSGY